MKKDKLFVLNYNLGKAAAAGDIQKVKLLVEKGANIHDDEEWALCQAAENGHLDVVKFLVEHGADIRASRNQALFLSAIEGHLNVVKYLVEQGANIDQYIMWVTESYRHLDILKFLKDKIASKQNKRSCY